MFIQLCTLVRVNCKGGSPRITCVLVARGRLAAPGGGPLRTAAALRATLWASAGRPRPRHGRPTKKSGPKGTSSTLGPAERAAARNPPTRALDFQSLQALRAKRARRKTRPAPTHTCQSRWRPKIIRTAPTQTIENTATPAQKCFSGETRVARHVPLVACAMPESVCLT